MYDPIYILTLIHHCSSRRKWQPTPVFLPGESQGRGSLVGCRLWGRTELDTTEATQQQQHLLMPSPASSHSTVKQDVVLFIKYILYFPSLLLLPGHSSSFYPLRPIFKGQLFHEVGPDTTQTKTAASLDISRSLCCLF